MSEAKTEFAEVIDCIDAGTLTDRINAYLDKIGQSMARGEDPKRKASLELKIDFNLLSSSIDSQLKAKATVKAKFPTNRGDLCETESSDGVVHVGRKGRLMEREDDEDINGQFQLKEEGEKIFDLKTVK